MSEPVTQHEAESMAREFFENCCAMPVEQIESFLDVAEAELAAEGVPEKNIRWALRPYRDRLYAERGVIYDSQDVADVLEQLADEGRLERRGSNEKGEPVYRYRRHRRRFLRKNAKARV